MGYMPKHNSVEYRNRKRRRLAAYQDNLCFYCEKIMIFSDEADDPNGPLIASYDHFHSRATGGSGDQSNLVLAHRVCNSQHSHFRKSEELYEKFRALNIKRGFGDELGNVDKHVAESALRLDSFMKYSVAAEDFFQRINEIPFNNGGNRIRTGINRALTRWSAVLKELSKMDNKTLAYKMAQLWISDYLSEREPFCEEVKRISGITVKTYLTNIFTTSAKHTLLRDTYEPKS